MAIYISAVFGISVNVMAAFVERIYEWFGNYNLLFPVYSMEIQWFALWVYFSELI